jgi:hypothetical protein
MTVPYLPLTYIIAWKNHTVLVWTGFVQFCVVLFTIQNVQNWNWGYGQSYKTGTAVPVLNWFGSVQFRFFFSFEYQTCKH